MNSMATASGIACLVDPPVAAHAKRQRVGLKAFPLVADVLISYKPFHPIEYLSISYTATLWVERNFLDAFMISGLYLENILGGCLVLVGKIPVELLVNILASTIIQIIGLC